MADDKTQRILITFPVGVDIPSGWDYKLHMLVDELCREWERNNPGHVMWPAGNGSLMVSGLHDDKPEFDNTTYHISVASREEHEEESWRRSLREKKDVERMTLEQIDDACTKYLGLPALIDPADVIMIHDLARQGLILRERVAEMVQSLRRIDPELLNGNKKARQIENKIAAKFLGQDS